MTGNEKQVIIVGSGPSGAAAAHVLATRGVQVTVIDAGQAMPRGLLIRAFGRTVFKAGGGQLVPTPIAATGDPTAIWFSALAPGGLSNHWTGAHHAMYRGCHGDDNDVLQACTGES